MIAVLEMLVTASLLSGAAAACLKAVPRLPPGVRLRLALAGLAVWIVPWPLLSLPFEVPMPAWSAAWREAPEPPGPDLAASLTSAHVDTGVLAEAAGRVAEPRDAGVSGRLAAGEARVHARGASEALASVLQGGSLAVVLVLLFLPGMLRFIADTVTLRASLEAWRAASRSGDALRGVLPPDLRDVRASIRIVPGSAVAATSGWLRPVVWLGDRLTDRNREVALVHELWHVRRRDPLRVTFVTALQRAYWWNPAVAWLCREAVLAMEAECDRRCARWFGVETYVERLASMMLDAVSPPAPRLLAHARTPNLNVRRLKLLETTARGMRPRDHLVVALTALLAAGSATYALARPAPVDDLVRTPVAGSSPADPFRPAVERKPVDDASIAPRPEWSRVPIPDTPAGDALKALLDAFNAGDSERLAVLLGAFTPQELAFDVPRSSRGLEIVAIVGSAPLEIEYVAEDRAGGARRHGRLEVHAWDTRRIARLEIRARSHGDLR